MYTKMAPLLSSYLALGDEILKQKELRDIRF